MAGRSGEALPGVYTSRKHSSIRAMTDYAVPEENSALIQALKQVLSCPIGKALGEIRLHEFEQCRYLLRHEKGPVQQVSLSFSAGQQLPKRADSFVADALRGLAQLTDPMDGYQLTLKVPLFLAKLMATLF